MITDVPGVRVGHWTDRAAATGCTVVLFPEGTVASGEARGGAPASRETDLLAPTRLVSRLDALVLTGGSAFGLSVADGVMRFCEERGVGLPTPGGVVPIVVAFGLFDLAVGDPSVRPGPDQGYAACEAARAGPVELGGVGAGTGATVSLPLAATPPTPPTPATPPSSAPALPERAPGGIGTATARSGDLVVSALAVVNAFGAVDADDAIAPDLVAAYEAVGLWPAPFGNTTIGLVATNATLDKVGCHLLAQSAHDGLARAVFPAHTRLDGDAFVAAAVGGVTADVDAVRTLAVHAVAAAIRSVGTPPGS
jgi:L-aminopeptidase/D-esterase-like protein